MDDNQKKELREDIKTIRLISAQVDYSNSDRVKKILTVIRAKKLFNSQVGIKYKQKLEKLSKGEADTSCLFCNGKISENAICCDSCCLKIFGVKTLAAEKKEMQAVKLKESKPLEDKSVESKPVENKSSENKLPENKKEAKVQEKPASAKKTKKSLNKLIFICFLAFIFLTAAKYIFNGVNTFSMPAGVVFTAVLILIAAAYLYLMYYKKEYEKKAGTNCGGLLDYKWSITQGIAVLLAFVGRPQRGETTFGIVLFIVCILIILFSEYAIYSDVLKYTSDKELAKKAMIAQFSAAFLIGFVIAIILIIVSVIMNRLSEAEKKIKEKDKNFIKTAIISVAVFSMMENLDSQKAQV